MPSELKIDEVDRRILHELQVDARRSNKALAEAAGVSPPTMLGRVRQLEERGIIRGYHADVDPAALGRTVGALVSVRLQPKTNEAVAEFLDVVWALEETVSVTKVTGPFDVLVHLSVRDVGALSDTVLQAIASAPNVVDEQTSIIFAHRTKRVLGSLNP